MESVSASKPRVCFEFEVEKIIGVSSDGNYQVQWAPAWVSKFHLVGCEHLIQEFIQQEAEKNIKPEARIELNFPSALNEMDSEQFPQQHSQPEIKTELEVQHNLPHTSNEVLDNGPNIDDFILQNTQLELKTELESDEDLCEGMQINVGIPQYELTYQRRQRSLDDGVEIPEELDLKSDQPINAGGYCVSDSHMSTGVSRLWTVNNEIVPMGQKEHHSAGKQPGGSLSADLTNTRASQYNSDVCRKEFSNKHNHETQIAHHETATEVTRIVKQPFSSANNQMLQHTIDRTCSICKKIFPSPSSLVHHSRMHTGEKPYKCPQCNKSFSQKCNLKKHLNTHTGEKPFSCAQCAYSCSQKSHLEAHNMRTHSGEKPFSCDQCGYSCGTRGHLTRHLNTQH